MNDYLPYQHCSALGCSPSDCSPPDPPNDPPVTAAVTKTMLAAAMTAVGYRYHRPHLLQSVLVICSDRIVCY